MCQSRGGGGTRAGKWISNMPPTCEVCSQSLRRLEEEDDCYEEEDDCYASGC
jgi:hypothetical protein